MPQRDRLFRLSPPHARLCLTAALLLTGSLGAQAITLGRFQTLSGIGEPLRAEIEITSMGEQNAPGLRAQVAPPPVFRQQGMEFNPALEGLTTTIERRSGGQAVIVLQGSKPVQDNFLDLILETQWAGGRLARNYAVLLGNMAPAALPTARPTPAPAPAPAALPSTPIDPSSPVRVELNRENIPVYRFDNPEPRQEANNPASGLQAPAAQRAFTEGARAPAATSGQDVVTVESGQTASGLALSYMPPSVTMDQMLIAMLRENPQAFIQENVNLVRAGATLRMPTAEQAQQTSPQQARAMVLLQHRAFADYARRLAENPLQLGKQEARETGGQVTDKHLQQPGQSTVQDTLKLSKPSDAANSPEAKLAAQQQAREASEQVDALQKSVADLQALMSASEASASPSGMGPGSESTPRSLWLWAAGLAVLLGAGLWWRNRRRVDEPDFAPAYDDEGSRPPHLGDGPAVDPIPAQMSRIDLDLKPAPSAPAAPVAPVPPPSAPAPAVNSDTESAKLDLAALLITKGDTAIARSLIESVLVSGSAEHRARALQMFNQLP